MPVVWSRPLYLRGARTPRSQAEAHMSRNAKVQLFLAATWFALIIPSLLFWKQSVPWLVFVSVYANFVGHLSAWEAARESEKAARAQIRAEDAEGVAKEAEDVAKGKLKDLQAVSEGADSESDQGATHG